MNEVKKFKKKPVVIEAIQWNGSNHVEIFKFMFGVNIEKSTIIQCIISNIDENDKTFSIQTLEGTMKASVNDWIIKGISNEFYPCKPDIFEKTYDLV